MGLEMVEVIMECEDEFGISIPDHMASSVRTVGELRDLIVRLTSPAKAIAYGQNGTCVGDAAGDVAETVLARLRPIIAAQSALRADQITPESRLVEDLGFG